VSLNLEVQILGEFKNLTRATKGATKQLKQFQGSVKGIARSINTTLAAIGVGISFNALKNGIQSAVSQASNLEESINAVRVSFGPAAEAVLAIGQNSAKSFGIARSEFNQAAVTFSAFADDIVGPGGDAAKLIEDLATRGADFASVYNIDVAEALRVFRSGLSGESEPLKRFGIILNETAVEQFAYARGIAETGKQLTNTQKVQARYALLMEETNKVQGDFANTSGSMANALRILRSSFADVGASIGSGFTPAISAAAQFITNNIAVFDSLGEAIGNRLRAAFESTGGAAESFGAKIILTIEQLTAFLNGSKDTNNVFVKFAEDFKSFFSVIEGVASIFQGLVAILDGFVQGLFGWLTIFPGVNEASLTFGGLLKGIGQFLQDVGYWVGFVASLFVPFGQGLLIVGRFITKIISGGKGLGRIFGDLGNVIRATMGVLDDFFSGRAVSGQNILRALGLQGKATFSGMAEGAKIAKNEFDSYTKKLDAQDNRRIKNFIDVITTNYTQDGGTLIPASPTTDNRPSGPLQPGYTERFIGRDDQWYTRTWTGYKWKITKDADAYKTPTTGGGGDTTFQTRVKAVVAKLQETLDEAKARIKNASESFRDAVGLSFGVITNGFTARFSVAKVIAQMKRIKDAVKTFSKDIIELRKKGADAALIDELIGLGPLAGSVAARELVTSGSLNEFLNLRKDLASSGAAVGAAGNIAITGTSTSGLQNAITALNKTIAAGKGNTYNINIANPNITPQQIIAEIKAYEKKTGKKVFSN
jgi:hypothetical protein